MTRKEIVIFIGVLVLFIGGLVVGGLEMEAGMDFHLPEWVQSDWTQGLWLLLMAAGALYLSYKWEKQD